MANGNALQEFNDFQLGTTSAFVSGPEKLVNEASDKTYWWGRFMDGALPHTIVKGGVDIKEKLFFETGEVTKNYKPGAWQDWENPQVQVQTVADWRFTISHSSWVEQEIILNEAIKYGSESVRFAQFVNIARQKSQVMWTDMWNFLDASLFAVPNQDEMEDSDGSDQYSLFAMVNEYVNGLFQNGPGAAWTTKQGINPAIAKNANWQAAQVQYSSSSLDSQDNVLGALDRAMHQTHFERPATYKEYFEDPAMRKRVVLTSEYGRLVVMHLLRRSQDHFVTGPQDAAYMDPSHNGIQIAYGDKLDTAAVYPASGSTNNTELDAATDNRGPRYYLWDANYMHPVLNDERYFYKDEPMRHHNVRDTWVQPCLIWWNLFTTSLRRQAYIYPTADPFGLP